MLTPNPKSIRMSHGNRQADSQAADGQWRREISAPTRPKRGLVSLWELMENFRPLAERMRRLGAVLSLMRNSGIGDDLVGPERDQFEESLKGIENEFEKFDLDAGSDCLEVLNRARRRFSSGVPVLLVYEYAPLVEAIIGQLGRRYYVPVPREVADFYEKPESKFPLSMVMFPSCGEDIREAGRCFALERYTACVFHAMGILQVGLFALAKECNVKFPFKIELAEWENVIAGIEKYIKDMRGLPKSDEKDADLKFFSLLATQFRFFKDAWRNHVAHLREEYDKDSAHSILIHVRDFMEQAATRLKEIPGTAP